MLTRRALRIGCLGTLFFVTLASITLAVLAIHHAIQGHRALDLTLADLQTKGEPITLEDFGLQSAELLTPSFRQIEATLKELNPDAFDFKPWNLSEILSQTNISEEMPPLRALRACLRPQSRERGGLSMPVVAKSRPFDGRATDGLPHLTWQDARSALKPIETKLAALAPLMQRGEPLYHPDHSLGVIAKNDGLTVFQEYQAWLTPIALVALHEDRIEDFHQCLRQIRSASDRLLQEQYLISLLVRRQSADGLLIRLAWELLQVPSLDHRTLVDLAALCDHGNCFGAMARCLRSERALMLTTAAYLAKGGPVGRSAINIGVGHAPPWWLHYWSALHRTHLSDAGLAKLVRQYQMTIDACERLALGEPCLPVLESLHAEEAKMYPGGDIHLIFASLLLEIPTPLAHFVKDAALHETRRRQVQIHIAIKRYQIDCGSVPEMLDALAPRYLPETPADPMDAKPMRYRKTGKDDFLLYGIGLNGPDDGGDPTRDLPGTGNPAFQGGDRDIVWPTPVTPPPQP